MWLFPFFSQFLLRLYLPIFLFFLISSLKQQDTPSSIGGGGMRQDRPRQLPVPAFSFPLTLFFLAPETVTSYSLRSLCFPYFLPKYGYQRTRTLFFQTHNTPCSGTAPGHTGDIPLRDTLPDSSFSYRPLRYLTYGSGGCGILPSSGSNRHPAVLPADGLQYTGHPHSAFWEGCFGFSCSL